MQRLYWLKTHTNRGTIFISYRLKNQYHGIQVEASNPQQGLERALKTIKELNLKSTFDKEVEIYRKTYLS